MSIKKQRYVKILLQPEYIRIEHKAIQDPCTALKAINTTLKKITTLEEDIKIKKHHDRWNSLYIGIGVGVTVLSAIGLVAFSLIGSIATLPGLVFLVLMLDMIPTCGFGMIAAPIATVCVVATPRSKKSLQGEQETLQKMIDSVSNYNFSDLKRQFDIYLKNTEEDEHGEYATIERSLTNITATDYFNLFKRAEKVLAITFP